MSGRLVVFAPERARRPGAKRPTLERPSEEELAACPFCEGREDQTPPETLALGREADEPNAPGWTVRVVPNLYPAFERQEVVVHTPRHVRSFADLNGEEIAAVAHAWAERAEEAWGEGYEYVHAFINEGREAGASRPHSHSQLVWLREAPPAVAAERQEAVADVLAHEDLLVAERHDVVAVIHPTGRVPYETLIAPRERLPDGFGSGDFLVAALEILADVVSRLRSLEGVLAWNAWLHDGVHWHFELVPRLTALASIELGAGIYVNTLPPERAAASMREAGG